MPQGIPKLSNEGKLDDISCSGTAVGKDTKILLGLILPFLFNALATGWVSESALATRVSIQALVHSLPGKPVPKNPDKRKCRTLANAASVLCPVQ